MILALARIQPVEEIAAASIGRTESHTDMDEIAGVVTRFTEVLVKRLDDHDVLIEMKTTQGLMFSEFRTLAKDQRESIADHERRIRSIERRLYMAAGAIALLEVALRFLVKT